MSQNGWGQFEPINGVQTSDGLATVDHSRATAAALNGATDIPGLVHQPDELLPNSLSDILWGRGKPDTTATTWGEALNTWPRKRNPDREYRDRNIAIDPKARR